MANIKSAKKRAKQSIVKRQRNLARVTAIKTAHKKVLEALASKDIPKAKELFKIAESKIARAKGKGTMHQNTAIRSISRLAKKIAAVEKAIL